MNYFLAVLAAAAAGYLLGSLNFSIIVVRLVKGQDIRTMGSKNAGLTNTLRCCGKLCGILTLIGDLGKGILAVCIARAVCSALDAGLTSDGSTYYIGYIAGFFAILGHIFPLYYGFRGGKGVLVGVSTFIVVDWRVFCVLMVVFIIVLAISRYVSLASVTAAALCPLSVFLIELIRGTQWQTCLFYAVLAIPMASIVIWMHRSNISRLKNGTENKFTIGK